MERRSRAGGCDGNLRSWRESRAFVGNRRGFSWLRLMSLKGSRRGNEASRCRLLWVVLWLGLLGSSDISGSDPSSKRFMCCDIKEVTYHDSNSSSVK